MFETSPWRPINPFASKVLNSITKALRTSSSEVGKLNDVKSVRCVQAHHSSPRAWAVPFGGAETAQPADE